MQVIYQVITTEDQVLSVSLYKGTAILEGTQLAESLNITDPLRVRSVEVRDDGVSFGDCEDIDVIKSLSHRFMKVLVSAEGNHSLLANEILKSLTQIKNGDGTEAFGKVYGDGNVNFGVTPDMTEDTFKVEVIKLINEEVGKLLQLKKGLEI